MMKLTAPERAMLDAMKWTSVRAGWVRAGEVSARTGQSPQGAALVLASLSRKGLVLRSTRRGHVWFALTDAGWTLGKARAQQAREITPANAMRAEACGGTGLYWNDAGTEPRCPHCLATPAQIHTPDPGPGEDPQVPPHPVMTVWGGTVDVVAWRMRWLDARREARAARGLDRFDEVPGDD